MGVSLPHAHTKVSPGRALSAVPPPSWAQVLSPGPQNVTFFEIGSFWV